MFKNHYNVIGVMSGTSLDGVDIAHVKFTLNNATWHYKIGVCETIPYNQEWITALKSGINYGTAELETLNKKYTSYLGELISHFITKNQLTNLDAICSHGHTILHQPQNGFTLQIGNLPEIASYFTVPFVCDFRVQDVELGGQGAPLVPIGDQILFSSYTYCLNLGGFSNVSMFENGKRIAFDISPVNTVLNLYAEKLGFPFDEGGKHAAKGILNTSLFETLNALPFYHQPYPKSLGFEYVKDIILPLIEKFNCSTEDVLHTFTKHVAFQIAKVTTQKNSTLLVTGGGAYNTFLINEIQKNAPYIQITIPDTKTIEFKEALIFALLGVLKLRNEINVLASVTGAQKDHSSGKIFTTN